MSENTTTELSENQIGGNNKEAGNRFPDNKCPSDTEWTGLMGDLGLL